MEEKRRFLSRHFSPAAPPNREERKAPSECGQADKWRKTLPCEQAHDTLTMWRAELPFQAVAGGRCYLIPGNLHFRARSRLPSLS